MTVKFGKDSYGNNLLTIIYENDFIQIFPIEKIDGFEKLKGGHILEFLGEWEKEIGFPFSQKEMHIRDGIWVKKKELEEGK